MQLDTINCFNSVVDECYISRTTTTTACLKIQNSDTYVRIKVNVSEFVRSHKFTNFQDFFLQECFCNNYEILFLILFRFLGYVFILFLKLLKFFVGFLYLL